MTRICSGGILYRDGRILLAKRSCTREFYPDVWDIVGGHREEDEEPEKTLVREMQEEIGVTP